MDKQYNPDGFIPKHGGYERLITYQKMDRKPWSRSIGQSDDRLDQFNLFFARQTDQNIGTGIFGGRRTQRENVTGTDRDQAKTKIKWGK